MRWTQREIALAHPGCRVVTANADVRGDWAYCKVPPELASMFVWGWEVMHVPSGKVLAAALGDKRTARAICRRVSDLTVHRDAERLPKETVTELFQIVASEKDRRNARLGAQWLKRNVPAAGRPAREGEGE